jgi:cob(I)alamin adenosyltransferase
MKITTKFGDGGLTKFGTEIKNKGEDIFELLGGLDELQASLGICYEFGYDEKIKNHMDLLYKIMGSVYLVKPTDYLQAEIEEMEFFISLVSEKFYDTLTGFVLPKGSKYVAHLHLSRTIARRIERLFVRVQNSVEFDRLIIGYLNRLSDYLYSKAIYEGAKEND